MGYVQRERGIKKVGKTVREGERDTKEIYQESRDRHREKEKETDQIKREREREREGEREGMSSSARDCQIARYF